MTNTSQGLSIWRNGGVLWGASLTLVVASSCATTGARPDDMSAQGHRRAAEQHSSEANEHAAEYAPNAERTRHVGPRGARAGVNGDLDYDFGEVVYNPTAHHRGAAQRHQRHSEDHLAAAQALEQFEEGECASFPPTTRAVCPLLGQVASIEEIGNGSRVHLATGVNTDATATHIRCHLAYARSQGREGMDRCPLYLQGVQSRKSGESAVDLTVDDDSLLGELRKRIADHVTN